MLLLRIQGEFEGSKITLLGQNRFGACFYAYKRKSKLTFSMTENAKSLKYYPNTLRFNGFWCKNWNLLNSGVKSRPGLRATEQFRHFHSFFHQVSFLRRVPDIWSLLGAIFALSRPDSIWSMLYSFKRMLQIDFSARLLKANYFLSFWDSEIYCLRVAEIP